MNLPETKLKASPKIGAAAMAAMERVANEGGSPREQADAARAAAGQKLLYLPHQGKRERERAMRKAEKIKARGRDADGNPIS